jgi:arylsulfatase A-like enzyme
VYGERDGLTPFLDALAARATVFRRAYAQAPWTNPSVASLWTSRYPSQHGVVDFSSVLDAGAVTLAEAMHEAGYATAGFSANPLIARGSGFGQGFDSYFPESVEKTTVPAFREVPPRADSLAARALAWLDARPETPTGPVFLYLQLMETHTPYAPPEDLLASRFAPGERPDLDAVAGQMLVASVLPPGPEAIALFAALYDLEVRSVDRELRALFAALEKRGFLRDALVVFTADHGDEFGEHGALGHGRNLYEPVIHVPLLVVAPGQTERRDVPQAVSLIDVAPTVLAWAGAPTPAQFMGHVLPGAAPWNLGSWLAGLLPAPARHALAPEEPVVSELLAMPSAALRPRVSHRLAIVRGSEKVIAGTGGEREWYDLDADPGEHAPEGLAASERPALARGLESFLARVPRDVAGPRPAAPIDEETRRRLRALGYAD